MTANQMFESFRWMQDLDFFKSQDVGKDKIRIRGVALTSEAVSLNNRKYVEEEVKKSTSSLVGKPITINHDSNQKVGVVEWADFEDGRLEYYGVVSKEPYVTMLRNRSAEVKGVSVEADFLFLKCPKCGKKFDDNSKWKRHMEEVEYVKTPQQEVHGIVYRALSLVLAPEKPGVASATVQVMETVQNGLNGLFETVIREGINMSKNDVSVPYTVKEKPPEKSLPEKVTPPADEAPVQLPEAKPTATDAIALKEVATSKVAVAKLKFSLGEPFAGYTDFADCVAKNKDKENPEAYCGSIKHEAEGETWFRNQTTESVTHLNRAVETLDANIREIVKKFTEFIASAKPDDTSWKTELATIQARTGKIEEEFLKALPDQFKALHELIEALPKDDLTWKPTVEEQAKLLKTIQDSIVALPKVDLAPFATKEMVEALKKRADDEFASYKKDLLEYWKPKLEVAEKEAAELKKKVEERQKNEVKESENMKTRLDNLEDKLKPEYRGKAKASAVESPSDGTPYKYS